MNKLILISILVIGLGAVSEANILDWGVHSVRKLGNGILDTGAGLLNKMGLPGTDLALTVIEGTRKLGNGIVDNAGGVLGVEKNPFGMGAPPAQIVNPFEEEDALE